jgi:hypothetical protein
MCEISPKLQQHTFNSWVDCNQRKHVHDITFDFGVKVEGHERLTQKQTFYTDRPCTTY